MSFTTLREAAAIPGGSSAARFFLERLGEMTAASARLADAE